MAEAIASDLAAGLIRKLVSLATDEAIQVRKLDEDLETLRVRFELTGALLNDAHSRNLIMSTAKMWFNDLEALARDAEAFMDKLEYTVTLRKVKESAYPIEVVHQIEAIKTSFEKICERASDLGLKPEHLSSIDPHKEKRTTPPFQDQSLIVGRDDDISFLVNMVCSKDEEDLPINAILGMGGQGKTTLARIVYNKDVVIKMFPKRMWVTVSEDFDFMRILNQMVTSLASMPSVLENAEGIIIDLQKRLKGEKFLLVLDDVWNEEPEEWEKLRDSLLAVGGARGSSILVTTRSQKVIDAMRCSDPYQLLKLSDKESWELFEQRAFSDGGVLQTEAFVDLGKSMVERCGGLPLAIKALGGLLYSKKTEKEWLQIQNSEIWKSKGVLPSLRLSYDNLPYSSLKRCFAYCSVIPKDSYIHKDEIIEIWMALGFLSGDGSALMEDIGNEYFDILLWNSLLQDVVRDEYNNIYKCKMHDLVHDLALDVSGNCSATVATSHDFDRVVVSKALYVRLEGFDGPEPEYLRFSFVQALYAKANIFGVLLLLPRLRHLRVLVLNSVCEVLLRSIENLIYLKHLDISKDNTRYKLPFYIAKLYSLQTLRISNRHELPKKICNLINLRHLVIDDSDTGYMFIGIERLTCLQTMPPFVVSRDQNCLVGQLGGLKNLRGKLSLHDLDEVENFEEASKAKLCDKSNIQHLQLKWRNNKDERGDQEYNDEDVMEGLEAHPNLKELTVEDFLGKKFASWIKQMTNLVNITLKNCNRCEVLPPLGHLPKLRTMYIEGMENVQVIGNSFCGGVDSGALKAVTTTLYPSLIKLSLYQLPKLEEWVETVTSTGGIGQSVFPKLESLTIWECPWLRKMPNSSFPSLKELRIRDMKSSMIPEGISKLRSLKYLSLSGCTELAEIPESIEMGSISSLDLTYCKRLRKLPEGMSNLSSLQDLYLSGCSSLYEFHAPEVSINRLSTTGQADKMEVQLDFHGTQGTLFDIAELLGLVKRVLEYKLLNSRSAEVMNLKVLHISNSKLSEIPDNLSFPNLQELFLKSTLDLSYFPSSFFERMPALKVLNISNKSITTLPPSLSKLIKLEELVLRDGELLMELPPDLGALVNLKTLVLSGCTTMAEFPDYIDFPRSLFSLDLSDCKSLTKLPESVGKMTSLQNLDLSGCLNLFEVPTSLFERLPPLQVLNMSNTSIKTLPSWVFKLTELEELILRRCELLMELPGKIGALKNLKVLDLEGTDLVSLPEKLGGLIKLKCLKVSLCDDESYRRNKDIVEIIPKNMLLNLTQLEELNINVDPHDTWCNALVAAILNDLPELRNLKTLKLHLPTIEILQNLLTLVYKNNDLPIYRRLLNFSFIIGPQAQRFISHLPCELEEEFLKLEKCLKYVNGRDITTEFAEALKHANALYLDRHWTIQKLSVFKFEDLTKLKFCLMVDCNEMKTVFDGSDFNLGVANNGDNILSLQYLAIHYLKNLEEIGKGPSVGCCLQALKVLVLHMCPNLTTIFTPVLLGDLVNLEEIIVEDCAKITSLIAKDSTQLNGTEYLPRLKKMTLLYLPKLESISSGISIGPELENVIIYDCPKLKTLPSLGVHNEEVIKIKGKGEWWNALEWIGGRPRYAFSELDMEGDFLDELATQYVNSLRLFVECNAD